MTDGTPRTTVVIPVWDAYAGRRLLDAVDSVLRQDRPARVLLVDNASKLELPEITGVEIVRSGERLSLGAARNLGLGRVTTANVVFWDADDLMLPGALAVLEEGLDGDSGLVAFGAAIVEDPSGVRHRWPRRWISRLIPHRHLFAVVHCVWSMFPTTGSTVMRADMVRACGGFGDANSGEDWSLGAALVWRGGVGWTERPGRRYLQHEGSTWNLYGSPRHQLVNAHAVRRRLAADPEVPAWLRASVPMLAALQVSAVAAHAAAARLRSWVRRGTGAGAA